MPYFAILDEDLALVRRVMLQTDEERAKNERTRVDEHLFVRIICWVQCDPPVQVFVCVNCSCVFTRHALPLWKLIN